MNKILAKSCCCCGAYFAQRDGNTLSQELSKKDMQWLLSHTNYNEKEIKQQYDGFKQDYPKGGIRPEHFKRFFHQNKIGSKMAQLVFRTLDTEGRGFLDFKEFILAIDLVAARNPEEKLLWAFKIYDLEGVGAIAHSDLDHVMKIIYNMLDAVDEAPKDDARERAKKMSETVELSEEGKLSEREFLRGCQQDADLMSFMDMFFNKLASGF